MQRLKQHGLFATLVTGAVLLGVWLWGLGGSAQVTAWAAAEQREVQRGLAMALRAVRGGEPWALASLLGLCFAYGFFHAAGPGHGKLVMGGYALGEDVSRSRLIGVTLAGALGQAVTAIGLVGAGALALGWTRERMTGLADGALQVASAGAVVLVGLWLLSRGLRRWFGAAASVHDHDDCGHVHGPDPEAVATASAWREVAALVLAVAIRPCTGALFVLILTFGMGIAWAGIMGAVAMSLGTALLTLAVALGAGHLRAGLAERMAGAAGVRMMALVEMLAGVVVALLAGQLLLRLL
jgi:nickel/cobalt exporter